MSQPLVFLLLALALVLPILGASLLRILIERLSPALLYAVAALVFGSAIVSVLLLARANVTNIQVGELSLLLPAAASHDDEPTREVPSQLPNTFPTAEPLPAPSAPPTEAVPTEGEPTSAPTSEPTSEPTTPPTTAPTETPSATLEPPTPEPPTAAPTAAAQRTYVVQVGDTLRGIAEQFGVSVQALVDANDLTPAQADSLRVGQELIIP